MNDRDRSADLDIFYEALLFIAERPLGTGSHYGRGRAEDPHGAVTNEDYAGMLCEFASGARGSFEASRSIVGSHRRHKGLRDQIADMDDDLVLVESSPARDGLSGLEGERADGVAALVLGGGGHDSREQRPTRPASPRLRITQNDVRAIQLAKAALYAGARLLMDYYGVDEVDQIIVRTTFSPVTPGATGSDPAKRASFVTSRPSHSGETKRALPSSEANSTSAVTRPASHPASSPRMTQPTTPTARA